MVVDVRATIFCSFFEKNVNLNVDVLPCSMEI